MNCDRIARWYRYLEYASFGLALQRRRCHFLPELNISRRVLMLGEGDGRFLTEFVSSNPHAEVDYVDSSAKMLALAASRVQRDSRVRFHQLDVLCDPPPGSGYDLIVTHFFLDCFTDAQLTIAVQKIAASADPEARWVVSEFRVPTSGWQRWRAQTWIRGLYFGFRVMTGLKTERLPDYARELKRAGFEMQLEAMASAGLLTSQIWAGTPRLKPPRHSAGGRHG